MKSDVYKINKGETDLGVLLTEAERVSVYNSLNEKESLYLRLLAEELVSMLPSIVESYSGEFWIANNGNDYELCTRFFVA